MVEDEISGTKKKWEKTNRLAVCFQLTIQYIAPRQLSQEFLIIFLRYQDSIARCNFHNPSAIAITINTIDSATAASSTFAPNQRYTNSAG